MPETNLIDIKLPEDTLIEETNDHPNSIETNQHIQPKPKSTYNKYLLLSIKEKTNKQ